MIEEMTKRIDDEEEEVDKEDRWEGVEKEDEQEEGVERKMRKE